MKNTMILTALVLVLGAGAAQAQLIEPADCGTTREGVADNILFLAQETLCGEDTLAGSDPLFLFKGTGDCVIQRKLVRKLDADPVRPNKPRSGAATKVLQAKDETALAYLQDYIDGIDKSRVVPGNEDTVDELRTAAEVLRDVCVPGVASLPPVD
jgi:hypothetical protein